MSQSPAQILNEFNQKLDDLKKKSFQLVNDYHKNRDLIKQHLIICRLKHKPVKLNIIVQHPDTKDFIRQTSKVQKEIIGLRNDYLKLLTLSNGT